MKYIFKKKRNILLVGFLDAIGYFLSWIFRPKKRRKKTNPDWNSVLIVRIDHLGDVLSSTAIPKIIKENFSGAKVYFLTSSWAAPLLKHNPFVDEVLIFDAPWFSRRRYRKSGDSRSFWSLARFLRKARIEAGVSFRGDFRESALMWLGAVRERVGFGVAGGGFFLTREIIYRKLGHESEHVLDVLRGIGIKNAKLNPQIYFSEEEESRFASKLAEWGIVSGQRYVGFQAEAGTRAKEWPAERTHEFLKRFQENFPDCRLVRVGAQPDDVSFAFIDLTGKTSLRDLCLLMRKLDAFVGFDSGATHLAAAMGVPTVFLYSGTNRFEQWRPLSPEAVVIRHPVPCSPCHLEVCNVPGHPCMSQIAPDEVIKALEGVLK